MRVGAFRLAEAAHDREAPDVALTSSASRPHDYCRPALAALRSASQRVPHTDRDRARPTVVSMRAGLMRRVPNASNPARDPEAALVSFLAGVPDAPPIRDGRRVGPVLGRIEMPDRVRVPVAPGLTLVGDAALATDPLSSSRWRS